MVTAVEILQVAAALYISQTPRGGRCVDGHSRGGGQTLPLVSQGAPFTSCHPPQVTGNNVVLAFLVSSPWRSKMSEWVMAMAPGPLLAKGERSWDHGL